MPAEEPRDIERLFLEGTEIDAALQASACEARLRHKQLGLPVVVWHEGRAVWVPPESIDHEGRITLELDED